MAVVLKVLFSAVILFATCVGGFMFSPQAKVASATIEALGSSTDAAVKGGMIDSNKRRESNPLSSSWFKKKQRTISKKQKKTISSNWKEWGIDLIYGCAIDEIDKHCYNALEIGHGKGDFLIYLANASTADSRKIFGCEIHRASIAVTLDKIMSANATNVKLIKAEVTNLLLNNYIIDDSLDDVYILYPDPWSHKKDSNKRVIRSEILRSLKMKMKSSGSCLYITTDSTSYRDYIKDVMLAPEFSCFRLLQEELTTPGTPPSWRIATHYENKTVSSQVYNLVFNLSWNVNECS